MLVGCVGADRVRAVWRYLVDFFFVLVDDEHLRARVVQGFGQRDAEASEPEDLSGEFFFIVSPYPIIILAVGYFIVQVSRLVNIIPILSGPSLPIIISTVNTYSAASE